MPKRLLTLVATAGLGIAGLAATAGTPADAAQPQAVSNCTTVQTRNTDGFKFYVPTSGGNPGRNCQMSASSHSKTASTPVRNIQVHMNTCYPKGLGIIDVDGFFGTETYKKLRWVQGYEGISPVDGIYGRLTHNGIKFSGKTAPSGGITVSKCVADAAV
jgi:hypothetical protein